MSVDQKEVGKNIATHRRLMGMTQKELGNLLGVVDKTISRWENGYGMPDIAMIPGLAEAFGISIEELLGADIGEYVKKEEANEAEVADASKKKYFKNRIRLIAILSVTALLLASAVTISLLGTGVLETYESTYVFEAEDALFTDSFAVEDVSGVSGGKVAAWMHTPGTLLTFKVRSNRNADVKLGIVVNRATSFLFEDKMQLIVNDAAIPVGIVPGIGWDGSSEGYYYSFGEPISVAAGLKKGENLITVKVLEGHDLNIDCIELTTTAHLTLMLEHYDFEAENAAVDGFYSVIDSDLASGGKYLGELDNPGVTIGFAVTAEQNAFVIMEIYVNRPYVMNFENKFLLTVNDVSVPVGEKAGAGVIDEERQCSFTDPFTVGINLQEGENEVVFTVVNGANFDKIAFNTSMNLTCEALEK